MGTISGTVYYSESSYAAPLAQRLPIQRTINYVTTTVCYVEPTNAVKDMPITIWNGTKGIVVKTDANGKYNVTNVPAGNYHIIETFSADTNYTGNATFTAAIDMGKPVAEDPTVEFIGTTNGLNTNSATRIASITRNTRIITIAEGADSSGNDFIDAPVIIKPYQLGIYYKAGDNLIKSVDGGTFGIVAEGTPEGTSYDTNPYLPYSGSYTADVFDTDTTGNLTYVKLQAKEPNGGKYTICNIASLHTFSAIWFDTSGHLLGDETGRFLIVNGNKPGTFFFREAVQVEKDADYLISAWIMNIYRWDGGELPLFRLEVKNSQNKTLYNKNITVENPLNVTKVPTWVELGAVLTADEIGDDTALTVKIYSEGDESAGNDYCVDDISLVKVEKADREPTLTKNVEKSSTDEDELKYKVTLTNTMADDVYNLVMYDDIPYGAELASNKMSIKVEDVSMIIDITKEMLKAGINISNLIKIEVVDPEKYSGIAYYDSFIEGKIPRGLSLITEYEIIVPDPGALAGDKMLRNEAMYKYLSPLDSIDVPKIVISNKTETPIPCPEIKSHKEGPDITKCNENYEYIITFTNTGDGAANTEEIKETLPENFVMESLAIKNGTKLLEKGTDYNYTDGENPLVITSINKGLRIAANSILTITINGHYPCDKMNS